MATAMLIFQLYIFLIVVELIDKKIRVNHFVLPNL